MVHGNKQFMDIIINIDDPVPQFAQLINQIKAAVQKGKIKSGDALPSIRQLANDLGLNNKTVAKAYSLLERDSVIQTKGYRGTFVHPDALKNCSVDLNAILLSKLEQAVEVCRALGATDSEIRMAFGHALQNPQRKGA
jgi:DNA-binding transcriptional regulator YhcF (GntR family)